MATKKKIQITHFVNPHLFYFKTAKSSEQLVKLENRIVDEVKNTPSDKNFRPEKGDIVAFLNRGKHLDKWIRAIVDHISEFTTKEARYILWAIDYGVPVRAPIQSIRPLSLQLAHIATDIYCGSIMNCVPAASSFSTVTNQIVLLETEQWSECAIETMTDLIEVAKSSSMEFGKDQPRDNCKFGKLEFTTEHGHFDAAEILIQTKQAKSKKSDDFFNELHKMKTFKIERRWKNYNESCYASASNCVITEEAGSDVPKKQSVNNAKATETADLDPLVIEKIKNWYIRNEPDAFNFDHDETDYHEVASSNATDALVTHPVEDMSRSGGAPISDSIESSTVQLPAPSTIGGAQIIIRDAGRKREDNAVKEPLRKTRVPHVSATDCEINKEAGRNGAKQQSANNAKATETADLDPLVIEKIKNWYIRNEPDAFNFDHDETDYHKVVDSNALVTHPVDDMSRSNELQNCSSIKSSTVQLPAPSIIGGAPLIIRKAGRKRPDNAVKDPLHKTRVPSTAHAVTNNNNCLNEGDVTRRTNGRINLPAPSVIGHRSKFLVINRARESKKRNEMGESHSTSNSVDANHRANLYSRSERENGSQENKFWYRRSSDNDEDVWSSKPSGFFDENENGRPVADGPKQALANGNVFASPRVYLPSGCEMETNRFFQANQVAQRPGMGRGRFFANSK